MQSDISSSNSADTELHPFQLDLYPLDPWGANQLMAIVERPSPGIVRALIGPVILGGCEIARGSTVRCLAVAEDRTLVSSLLLPRALLHHSPGEFWGKVFDSFARARELLLPLGDSRMPRVPPDCLKTLSSPWPWILSPQGGDPVHTAVRALSQMEVRRQTDIGVEHGPVDYMRIEAEANGTFCEQIAMGVRHLLQALVPALFKILVQRPKLSIAVAHQMLCTAKLHSSNAVTYALQAMQTESQGLLHLIASDHPKEDAQQVRNAIFSGHSVPDAFVSLGVAKAGQRQSLRKPARRIEQWQEPELSISDLPIAGRDWLTAMRQTQHIAFHNKRDWFEFRRTVQLVIEKNFQHEDTALQLLQCCTLPTVTGCSARLRRIITHASALCTAVKGLTDVVASFEDIVSKLLKKIGTPHDDDEIYEPDFQRSLSPNDLFWQLAIGVAYIADKSFHEVFGSIFQAHPMMPSSFVAPDSIDVYPIDSLDGAMSHGSNCLNCLRYPTSTVQYVAGGVALYGLRSDSGVIGTIALQYPDGHSKCSTYGQSNCSTPVTVN